MKRLLKLVAVTAIVLALAASVAFAATVLGTPGRDTLRGSNGADFMKGRGGADIIYGRYGNDTIYGGDGNDVIKGGYNADKIYGGPGKDTIDSESGPDFVNVAGDGRVDSVSCGVGVDTAVVDAADVGSQSFEDFVRLSSCENVTVR